MNWNESIDVYCERVGPELFSEPLNAFSNFAFIIAAIWLLRARENTSNWYRYFASMIFVIGIGSLLFHTFATHWASLADVLPIFVFILSYIGFLLRITLGLALWWGVPLALAYYAGVSYALQPLSFLQGTWLYAPAWLTFFWMSLLLHQKGKNPKGVLMAGGVFTFSLTMRVLDDPFCAINPYGTHFLWHISNAMVLSLLAIEAQKLSGTK